MIYIDTSAAVKLVRPEAHSTDLSDWLREQRAQSAVLTSVVIEVELMRATRPSPAGRAVQAVGLLADCGATAILAAPVGAAVGTVVPVVGTIGGGAIAATYGCAAGIIAGGLKFNSFQNHQGAS